MDTNHGVSEGKVAELLRKLILIPSGPHDDKREITEQVLRSLEGWGFACEVMGESGHPAILATKGSGGVLLSGHLDTVPLGEGWTAKQGELRGTTLYGRGAADMKGGCSAMLLAAEELSGTEVPLSLAFTTDEETGMKGADRIAKHEAVSAAPAVIVCEPTLNKIGARQKGLLQIRLIATGRSAHAAMPKEGDNAVHKMLSALGNLIPMTKLPDDPIGNMTLSISVMRGGEKVNVIPDHCVAEIDIRTPPEIQPMDAFKIVSSRLAGTELDVQITHQLKSIVVSEGSAVLRKVRELRPGIGMIDIAYATELVKYSESNGALLAIGPGDPTMAHRADEKVDLREVAEATKLYCDICAALEK